MLGGLEYFWRSHGHQPAIVDDQRLWAMERSRVGKSNKEIVLLGSSRMQTDISMGTLHRVIPDYSIINLAVAGTCASAVLHDIASDDKFSGTVVMETTSECIMFGNDRKLSQQSYVDYFHKTYNLNIRLNRQIATFMQHNLVIIDPWLSLIKVIGNFIVKKTCRAPNYLTNYEDRTHMADYTKLDISRHKADRLKSVDKHYKELLPRISTQFLMKQLASIDNDVKRIIHRGGKVVFVRFPVSDEHWNKDEQYFPRATYWDTITPQTSAYVMHFKDIEEINTMQCPDTSHLDFRDTEAFTIRLLNELLDIGAI